MKDIIVPSLAIVVLGALEGIALINHIDGAIFSSVAIIIAGIAGYKIKAVVSKKKNGN